VEVKGLEKPTREDSVRGLGLPGERNERPSSFRIGDGLEFFPAFVEGGGGKFSSGRGKIFLTTESTEDTETLNGEI
jgi:hypothetical protein